MCKIILLPLGTTGDLLPMIWIGRQLSTRGHQAALLWLAPYRELVEQAGLEFVALDDEGRGEPFRDSNYWRPHSALKMTYDYAGFWTILSVNAVMKWMEVNGPPDLLMAPIMNFTAPILRAKLGVPLITTHMTTLQLMSAHEVPLGVPCARLLRMLPLLLRRKILNLVAPYDHLAKPYLRKCCAEHGVRLPHWLREWFYSPDGSLVLFPSWYDKPQMDWPVHTLQWDFPLEDLADASELDPALVAFLDAGDSPVVFRFGNDPTRSRRFYEVAAELTTRIGGRAVFVTRHGDPMPDALPASIFVTTFVPFSRLLTRSSACVHYGGIGTVSQCFAAGLPQIVVPLVFDQFDNACYVERLGAGLKMDMRHWSVANALPLLRSCVEENDIRRSARMCAERLRNRRPAAELAEWLESKMSSSGAPSAA